MAAAIKSFLNRISGKGQRSKMDKALDEQTGKPQSTKAKVTKVAPKAKGKK